MRRAFTSVSENPAYDARIEESPRSAGDAVHREAELHQARGALPEIRSRAVSKACNSLRRVVLHHVKACISCLQ